MRVLFIQVNKHHAMVKGQLELTMPILLNNWLIRIHSCIGISYLKQVGKFQLNRPDWASMPNYLIWSSGHPTQKGNFVKVSIWQLLTSATAHILKIAFSKNSIIYF